MFSFFVYFSKENYNKLKCYFIDIKFRIFKQFNMTDENQLGWNGYDEFFCRTSCRQIRSVTIIVSECQDSCILSQDEGKDGWQWYRHSNYDMMLSFG